MISGDGEIPDGPITMILSREASHRDLHNLVMGDHNDSHQAARDVFNLMFKNGWYNLTSTPRQSLQQTKDQFTNYQA